MIQFQSISSSMDRSFIGKTSYAKQNIAVSFKSTANTENAHLRSQLNKTRFTLFHPNIIITKVSIVTAVVSGPAESETWKVHGLFNLALFDAGQ